MTAYQIHAKTTERVQTWSMTTGVIVWQDSMAQIVKVVRILICFSPFKCEALVQ